jgi:hypothetical protein
MISRLTDVAPVNRTWLVKGIYPKAKARERFPDAFHFSHATGRTWPREYRASRN